MTTQFFTLQQFADLLSLETQLGIVDGGAVIQSMMKSGLPKKIFDIRGALRLALASAEEGLEITTYSTELSRENLLENVGVR